jgi:hypothetical protein
MKITPRGYFVAGFLSALMLGALWYFTSHFWWIGDTPCLGTLTQCLVEQAPVDGGNS